MSDQLDPKNKWKDLHEANPETSETHAPEGIPLETKTPEEVRALENALDEMRQLLEASKNDHLRVVAEMDNQRRRCERDVEAAHKYGVEKIIRELLPAVDSLEKSLEHATDDNLRQGVQMTLDLLLNALKKFNVTVVDPVGKPFNPVQQEAISAVPTADAAPNTVLQVLQKGYLLSDRLVRPALVIVSKVN